MAKRLSQPQLVINYLIEYGHISGQEAWTKLGIYRLSDAILKLREKGNEIETVMKKGINVQGNEIEYGDYYLRRLADEQVQSEKS